MKRISIGIKLPSNKDIKADLEQLLKYMEKSATLDLKLDISAFKGSLNDMEKSLTSLKAKLKDFGVLDSFMSEVEINKTTKAIENQNEELIKQQKILNSNSSGTPISSSTLASLNKDGTKSILKDVTSIRDELGNIVQVTNKYDKSTSEILSTTVKVTEETEKQRLAQEKATLSLDKFQSKYNTKLTGLGNNEFIDTSIIEELQKKLNSFTTNTATKELYEFENVVKNLGNAESSIVRLQSAILRHNTSLDLLKSKYKDVDLPSGELQDFTNKLRILENEMKILEGGGTTNRNHISSILSDATSSARTLSNETKILSDQQRLYNKEVVTFSGAINDVLTKTGLFSIAYSAVHALSNAFMDGIQSVVDMDTAMANLNKVVELSSSQLDVMRDSAVAMGEELGRSSIEIANAQAEFGRMYKSIDEINKMTEASILGANIMDGVTADQVAKGLTTILSSMGLEATEVMTVLDSMNEVQNNYRVSATDMLDALGKVGSTANVAGASLQELEGYITAMTVATGKSGDEVGTSLKTLASRIFQVGQEGIDAQGKPEKMLNDMGVAVRDLNNEFRPLNDILADLDKEWKQMSNTEKIATSQIVAGTHKYNDFIALMENFDMATSATATAMDSMGSAVKENEIYLNSIEGRFTSLKATTEGFWYDFIDSDMLKGGISLLQIAMNSLVGMQDTFGNLGLTIGTTTMAFTLFTNNPLKNFFASVKENTDGTKELNSGLFDLAKSFATTSTSANGSTVSTFSLSAGFKALGTSATVAKLKVVALQTVLSMGLGLIIMGVVGAVSKLASGFKSTEERMEDVTMASKNLSDALSTIESTNVNLNQYKLLKEELENIKISTERRLELEKEIANITNTISSGDSQIDVILKNTNLSLEQQLMLIKQINYEKAQALAIELDETLGDGIRGNGQSYYETQSGMLDEYIKNREELNSIIAEGDGTEDWYAGAIENLETMEEKIVSTYTKLQLYNSQVKDLHDVDVALDTRNQIDISDEADEVISDISNIKDEFEDLGDSADGVDMSGLTDGLNEISDTASTAETALQELGNTFSGLSSDIGVLEKALSEFNTHGIIDTSTMESILNTGDAELISLLSDVNSFSERGNELLEEKKRLQDETLQNAINTANQEMNIKSVEAKHWTEEELAKLNTALQTDGQIIDSTAEATTWNMRNYGIDSDNKVTAEIAKLKSVKDFLNNSDEGTANLVNALGSKYGIDVSNYINSINEKIRAYNRWLYNATSNTSMIVATYGAGVNPYLLQEELKKEYAQLVGHSYGQSWAGSSGVGVGNIGSVGHGNTGVSGGGSSSSGSSGGSSSSSGTNQASTEVGILTDRYFELNNAIKENDYLMALNQAKQRTATGSEANRLLLEEIELIKQKIELTKQMSTEYQKESNEIKNSNLMKEFRYDIDGNISNLNEIMARKQAYANELTGDARDEYLDYIDTLQESIDKYQELNELINDNGLALQEANQELKEIAMNELEETRDQLVDALRQKHEEERETKKEVLDERIEALQEELDSLDDELEDKQKRKEDLEEELAKWQRDDSVITHRM